MIVFERLGTHMMGESGCTVIWGLSRDLFGLWDIRKKKNCLTIMASPWITRLYGDNTVLVIRAKGFCFILKDYKVIVHSFVYIKSAWILFYSSGL